MKEGEKLLLEKLVNNIWKNLNVTKIHIKDDRWELVLKSLVNGKNINAELRVYDSIKFNVKWEFKIKEKNINLYKYLDSNKPMFLFAIDLSSEKFYYQDLQSSARKYYPIDDTWNTFIYINRHNTLSSRASSLIADHIIEYNYNWKKLYKRYSNYISAIQVLDDFFNGKGTCSDSLLQKYLDESIEIYKSISYVYSKQDITDFRGRKFINLINKNIIGLKWLIKEERKYWTVKNLDFYADIKSIPLIKCTVKNIVQQH